MLRHKYRVLSIIIIGALMVCLSNFTIFVYYYKNMAAEHLTEYWRSIHGGRMFSEVLPIHLAVALVSVGILVFTTYRLLGSANNGDKR